MKATKPKPPPGWEIQVDPIPGESLRYLVASRSRPGHSHLVDLEEYNFNGYCACEWFQFHCMRDAENRQFNGPTYRCPHIRAAIRVFLRRFTSDEILDHLLMLESRMQKANKTLVSPPRPVRRRARRRRERKQQ